MEDTELNQAPGTSAGSSNDGKEPVKTPVTENNNGGNNEGDKVETPFKTFKTQEEFDKHSAGILNSAKNKAEKELLALLGLKPDEKDKLSKFKDAYESTLTEAEKQTKELESLKSENASLKSELAEKEAVISAITQSTGKTVEDVAKYVKMAKGLVDENTTIDQALAQVLELANKTESKTGVPKGTPLTEPSEKTESNPFKSDNLTEQGKLFNTDRDKARKLYYEAHGKYPSW